MKNNNDIGETEKNLNDVENESKFIDDKLEGGAVGDERDLHDKLSEGRKYDRPNSNKVQELAMSTYPRTYDLIHADSVFTFYENSILITALMQSQVIESQGQPQTCLASLGNLNVCSPFVLPGTSNMTPSTECCASLQSLDHKCICNTVRVVARLPSRCNLSPVSCSHHH
ncbi:hypothetical protein H5410_031909 [Solanum commersonii]|uniref:Bifunctional inhibitor/plant lipid transfer protein/seed storage helical domain-containing protein n=1 Tax=Solanum commersonii TaxID=4109 RepID=A0A9J5YIH6_SOLCO|nr:hypothetical protein H5410_031909 [Solanum commersonii]